MTDQTAGIPLDVLQNQTYAHQLARVFVRPLLGTRVRPNHLTVLRIVLGLASCATLASGTSVGALWSGVLWIVTCLLDRADGELARLGNLRSASGKVLDFYSDLILDSLWFLSLGFNASHGSLGKLAIALGFVCCALIFLCILLAELYERRSNEGVKTFYGVAHFHPDDALFTLPLFVWFGWQPFVLIAATLCASIIALIVIFRYSRQLKRTAA